MQKSASKNIISSKCDEFLKIWVVIKLLYARELKGGGSALIFVRTQF